MAGVVSPDQFQMQVIASRAPGIRVVAPAGSGKTETLVWRSIQKIEKQELRPAELLVLSFDNSAKRTYEQKFRSYAQRGTAKPVILTINQLGLAIIKEIKPSEKGTTDSPRLEAIRRKYNQQLNHLEVLHWDGRHRDASDVFKTIKNQGYTPREMHGIAAIRWLKRQYFRIPSEDETFSTDDFLNLEDSASTDQLQQDIDQLLAGYESFDEELLSEGLMGFEDQKLRALSLLRRFHASKTEIQARYKEIIVDECQDISRLDALLLYHIVGPECTLILAGDDDQSLYEFREANSAYLRDAKRYFNREFETIDLNLNYRTPQDILQPALALIDHNHERLPKSPSSAVLNPGTIDVLRAASESELVTNVATLIRESISPDLRLGDIAVLCVAPQLPAMRHALNRAGLPHQRVPSKPEDSEDPGRVVLGNLYRAKGRQWRMVILPSCIDGLIPEADALQKGTLEAQRRLLYVAMTRASERLVVGYTCPDPTDSALRTASGQITGTNGASRFLFEARMVWQQVTGASTGSTVNPASTTPAPVEVAQAPLKSSVTILPASTKAAPIPAKETTSIDRASMPSSANSKGSPRIASSNEWDLRPEERENLEKAGTQLEKVPPEYSYAVASAFPVIVAVLKRNVLRSSLPDPRADAYEVFMAAHRQGIVNKTWFSAIDRWRGARNRMLKTTSMDISDYDKDLAEKMVRQAPELFDYVRQQRLATSRKADAATGTGATCLERQNSSTTTLVVPVISGQRLFISHQRAELIGILADHIQSGLPLPTSGRPVKALKFNPDNFREEMILLQLHLILRDVRFMIARDYRWSGSLAMDLLCRTRLGHSHPAVKPLRNHGLSTKSAADVQALVANLDQALLARFPNDPVSALHAALFDAMISQNGNFSNGFKIRAYRT